MSAFFQTPKPAVRRSLALSEQRLRLSTLTQYSLSSSSREDFVDELNENHLKFFVEDLSCIDVPKETRKKKDEKKNVPKKMTTTFNVGDSVDADYNMDGEYYPAVVTAVSDEGITVQYDEDGIVETLTEDYVVLVAKAGTTAGSLPKSAVVAAAVERETPKKKKLHWTQKPVAVDPAWKAMLVKLCEYQKNHGYDVSPQEKKLHTWWIKTKKDYITKRKRQVCDMTKMQVHMLEEEAGWSYGYGQIHFPETTTMEEEKKKRDRSDTKNSTSEPSTPKLVTPKQETTASKKQKRELSEVEKIRPESSRPKRQCTMDVAVKTEPFPPKATPKPIKKTTKQPARSAKKEVVAVVTPEKDISCRPFPDVCHEMVTLVSKQMPHLVGWSKDGKAFFFHTTNGEGLEATFEQFFRHDNWRSFQRQLNNYRFVKQLGGSKYEGGFRHPLFRRNSKPADIAKILRKGASPPPKSSKNAGRWRG